ncbi:MAG: hypothetical protein QOJ56_416 [Mycobacterium sp.]|nr:hypothetical protein [Mycobacterium sp.]
MAVEIPTDRDPCWWEEAIITTRLRFAAGICVLSTGLLIGSSGGAIAWADTESTGSNTAQSQRAEGPSADVGSASAPTNKVANPLRTTLQATVQGLTSTLRSISKLGQQQSTAPGPAATTPAATNTETNNEGSGLTAADPSPTAADPNVVASDQNVVASDQTVVASESTAVPPATNPLPPVSPVVEPVTNAVATVVNVVGSVPAAMMALRTSPTPVTDVITTIQEMLTSATNAVVTLMQLPADLYSAYSLLSVPAATATTTVGGGVKPDANAPVLARRASQSLEVAPIFLAGGMALPADIAPLETLGDIATTGLRNQLPASGIASPAQNVIVQSGLGSFLEHTVSALFVPASLSALAAVALPGVGGLLIICGLGMRIGYRQAKALFEVRRAGIACFAGPGPLGVVRSGSLIALRPRAVGVRQGRALRVAGPDTSRAAGLQDQAA